MTPFNRMFRLLLLLSLAVWGNSSLRADTEEKRPRTDAEIQQGLQEQLHFINKTLDETFASLQEVKAALKDPDAEQDRSKLRRRRDKLNKRIRSLLLSLEEVATGGVKLSSYDAKKDKKPFNWQEELLEIFKPMIAEMKALTERPRAIEALRGEKAVLEERLPVAQSAARQIDQFKKSTDNKRLLERLEGIEKEWSEHERALASRLKLVNFKLEELLNPPDKGEKPVGEKIKDFALGRGLTMLLAMVSFLGCFAFFSYFARLIKIRLSRKENGEKQYFQRAVRLGLQFLGIMAALAVTMFVLYIRDDWLLLGLILIFLAAAGWGVSQALPMHLQTLKILMNIGSIREGERLIYAGVPWRVTSLNMYTTLTNPELSGGEIKIPIKTIATMVSRLPGKDESWFPTSKGDYVLLDDGTYGSVLMQSPDVVTLQNKCGHKSWATPDFLALNPRNLSRGYGIFLNFGLDYQHQRLVTREIPDMIRDELEKRLRSYPAGSDVRRVQCMFKEAGASSLDLKVIVFFYGRTADEYYGMHRFIAALLVELCNENDWNIPFGTLTLDMKDELADRVFSPPA